MCSGRSPLAPRCAMTMGPLGMACMISGLDVDDDGTVDLDGTNAHYLGVSLGGIMGAELVAFAPEFLTAVFIVPGARVGNIVAEGAMFSLIVDTFAGMATEGEVARFFPLLQGVIDRGDAGAYVGHVAAGAAARLRRVDAAGARAVVLNDDTVPNSTNGFFARARCAARRRGAVARLCHRAPARSAHVGQQGRRAHLGPLPVRHPRRGRDAGDAQRRRPLRGRADADRGVPAELRRRRRVDDRGSLCGARYQVGGYFRRGCRPYVGRTWSRPWGSTTLLATLGLRPGTRETVCPPRADCLREC